MTIVNRICVLLILFFAAPILPLSPSYTRRTVLTSLSTPFLVAGVVAPASAKTGTVASQQFATSSPSTKIIKVGPQVAYDGIKQAREELKGATKYLKTSDYPGMLSYLNTSSPSLSSFESNALSLLSSKSLDESSKKEIGTIRRYGVGADVMIMYGGLMNELSGGGEGGPEFELDYDEVRKVDRREVEKYLLRTAESLDEIIAICKSNGM